MTLEELITRLISFRDEGNVPGSNTIHVECGGDGPIHTEIARSLVLDKGTITISSEEW